MTKRRSALISAGIAAGALAAGTIGGIAVKRRHEHATDQVRWELPPQDLGEVESFDGTRISVHAAGPPEAPVLLFVHGFSLDGTTWFEQWMDLSTEFRCVVMDQRGHGRSGPAAHGDLSLRSMGRDIAAVLDLVSPERPAVLVGHSMGAMAILAMAEQRPELFGPRVAGVVLVGAASSDLLAGRDGVGDGAAAPAARLVQRGGAPRGPAPQGGAAEPRGRPRGGRAPDPVRARRLPSRWWTTSSGWRSGRPRRSGPRGWPS